MLTTQHALGIEHQFLTFFDLVMALGELNGIDIRGPLYHDVPAWDVPPLRWRVWLCVFQSIYVSQLAFILYFDH